MTIHNNKMLLNVNDTVSNAVDSQIILSYPQIFFIIYIYIYRTIIYIENSRENIVDETISAIYKNLYYL